MEEWSMRYEYTESEVKQHAPDRSGVYRLIYRTGDNYYVFYIGQAASLKDRLLEHLSTNEPNLCIKKHLKDYTCFFRYLEVSTQDERDKVEKEEIARWSPDCNTVNK
jgi:excinuclease UvrABC nuclease subunit